MTAYDMRSSYWSSAVCSSDLQACRRAVVAVDRRVARLLQRPDRAEPQREGADGDEHRAQHRAFARRECLPPGAQLRQRALRMRAHAPGLMVTSWRRRPPAPRLPVAVISSPAAASDVRMRSSVAGASTTRSEEHTSELQSLMRISYAVFCLKKQKKYNITDN